jgi:hypothetical protein
MEELRNSNGGSEDAKGEAHGVILLQSVCCATQAG